MILYHGSNLTVSEPKLVEQKKFEALLILIVPRVVALILAHYPMDEVAASKSFYESGVYALLEQEDTKLWQLSPLTLFNMYDEERKTGSIPFPEG